MAAACFCRSRSLTEPAVGRKEGVFNMACYHFTAKTDKSPDGLSIKSVTHSDYINREGKYKNYDYMQEMKRQTYGENGIGGVENAPVLLRPQPIYKSVFGSIKDFGDRFAVTDAPGSQTVDAALLLAVKRYGTRLSITGDPKFKAQVIAAALAMKVKIECPTDPDLQKIITREEKKVYESESIISKGTGRTRNFFDRVDRFLFGQSDLKTSPQTAPASRRGHLQDVSSLPVVSIQGTDEMLLRGDARRIMGQSESPSDHRLRWAGEDAVANHRSGIRIDRQRRIDAERIAAEIMRRENQTAKGCLHAKYINRQEQFSAQGGCVYTGQHLPKWANGSPQKFFSAADLYESVKGTKYREIEFALPNELDLGQQKRIVDLFLQRHFADFYYSFAIHDKIGVMSNGEHNTHVHIMFSERMLDSAEKEQERSPRDFFKGEQKCRKSRQWNGKDRAKYLCLLRADFADIQNQILQENGLSVRVDHRSLKAQREAALAEGNEILAKFLDRLPEEHIGPTTASDPQNPKVIQLKEYRRLRYADQKFLHVADILKNRIVEGESENTLRDISRKLNAILHGNISHSLVRQELQPPTSPLTKKRQEVLDAITRYEKYRAGIIWYKEAKEMATLRYMNEAERELYQRLLKVQHWYENYQKTWGDVEKPTAEGTQNAKAYELLMQGREEISAVYEKEIERLTDLLKPTFERQKQKRIAYQIRKEANAILAENKPAKDAMELAQKAMQRKVANLQDDMIHAIEVQMKRAVGNDRISLKTGLTAKEMNQVLTLMYQNLAAEERQQATELSILKPKCLTPLRVYTMARDVFTNHAFKKLHEKARELKKIPPRLEKATQELQEEKAIFASMAEPSLSDKVVSSAYHQSYVAAKASIAEKEQTLADRTAAYAAEAKAWNEEQETLLAKCATKAGKIKITRIARKILEKNQPVRAQYERTLKLHEGTKEKLAKVKEMRDIVRVQMRLDAQKKYAPRYIFPSAKNLPNMMQKSIEAMHHNQLYAHTIEDEAARRLSNSAKSKDEIAVEMMRE